MLLINILKACKELSYLKKGILNRIYQSLLENLEFNCWLFFVMLIGFLAALTS